MQPGKFTLISEEVHFFKRREWPVFLLVAAVAVLLTACQTNKVERSQKIAAELKAKGKVLVLFRVAAAIDYRDHSNQIGLVTLTRIGQMGKHEEVETFRSWGDPPWYALSKQARNQGWRYLLLEPGLYYVKVEPDPSELSRDEVEPFSIHAYSLDIPPGRNVIYAGSFEFAKNEVKQGHWKARRFLGTTLVQWRDLGIVDETADAQRIARETFVGLDDAEPIFPMDYDDLSEAIGSITNRQIVRIDSTEGTGLTNSDVGDNAMKNVTAPFLATGTVLVRLSDATGNAASAQTDEAERLKYEGASAAEFVAAITVAVVAAPFVAVADKTFGEAGRKKWAPYGAALAKEFNQFNLPQQLINETSNQLASIRSPTGNTNQSVADSGLVVQIQPYRVLLRETRHKKLALEIAVRVILVDPGLKMPLWQHDYVYSDSEAARHNPSFLPVSYETLIDAQSTPQQLEDYEQDTGVQLLHEQLAAAVGAISNDIAARFRNAGFSE